MMAADIPSVLSNLTWDDFIPNKNCELSGKAIAGALVQKKDESAISTFDVLIQFARACAPVSLSNVTLAQILDWNTDMLSKNASSSVLVLIDKVDKQCHRELCFNMNFEGNPDLSGIGVSLEQILQYQGNRYSDTLFSTIYRSL